MATPTAPAASAETATAPNTANNPPERIAAATMDLPSVALAALPPSTVISYRLNGQERGLNYQASGELRWQHNDTAYAMSLSVKAFLVGSRYWRSQGQITSAGLTPVKFSDSWRSERVAHFDQVQNRIVFSNNAPTAPLQPGAQDRLSLFMQLAGMLQAQPAAYPAGQLISLQVAGTSDAETWRFRVGEEETLALPAGNLPARRLVREPREPRDSRIDIWLAPTLAYLPVRIRITQDSGDRVDQQLSQMP